MPSRRHDQFFPLHRLRRDLPNRPRRKVFEARTGLSACSSQQRLDLQANLSALLWLRPWRAAKSCGCWWHFRRLADHREVGSSRSWGFM